MNYKILYDNPEEDLLSRLLNIRNVQTPIEQFINPNLQYFRKDPFLLSDMDIAVRRIIKAMESQEKIMIFGDYDVDGVTSSYMLYTFIQKFLKYKKVSIMYPHRRHDGYGIKKKHIDQMNKKNVQLIITVDNGITSLVEAVYSQSLGIDMIITDHHKNLAQIPQAHAVVNPHTSDKYSFKGLCGAGVAFKLIVALLDKSTISKHQKKHIFKYFLPIVAVATVADCVPLIDENRVFVKKGLELINKKQMPLSLSNFIQKLNIKGQVDTFHIGFLIGPRINAGGRIKSPYDSLYTLLYEGNKQDEYLENIENINTERKKLQDEAHKHAKKTINTDDKILISCEKEYHEGIVGIVAGRITEEHNKPSVILYINEEKGMAVGSLRGPEYFNVIEMLQNKDIATHLDRYGGHKQAGGLSVKLQELPKLIHKLKQYCEDKIKDNEINKTIEIDTKLYEHDHQSGQIDSIQQLAPFGIGNQEPMFLLEDTTIKNIKTVGKRETKHLKLEITHGKTSFNTMLWRKGSIAGDLSIDMKINLIGKIQKDTYNGGRFIEGKDFDPTP